MEEGEKGKGVFDAVRRHPGTERALRNWEFRQNNRQQRTFCLNILRHHLTPRTRPTTLSYLYPILSPTSWTCSSKRPDSESKFRIDILSTEPRSYAASYITRFEHHPYSTRSILQIRSSWPPERPKRGRPRLRPRRMSQIRTRTTSHSTSKSTTSSGPTPRSRIDPVAWQLSRPIQRYSPFPPAARRRLASQPCLDDIHEEP